MPPSVAPRPSTRSVCFVPDLPALEEGWNLSGEESRESADHRETVDLLRRILLGYVVRTRRDALVAVRVGCRWNAERPGAGVAPELALIEPSPPEDVRTEGLRTWLEGHAAPRLAIDVVGAHNVSDDDTLPARYARLGTRELIVFDPGRRGPAVRGGPHVLEVWRRNERARGLMRVYAGDGPAESEELGAWLIVTEDRRLRVTDDEDGKSLWLTAEESAEAARRKAEELAQAAERRAEEEALGRRRALVAAIEDLCELGGIPASDPRLADMASLSSDGLEALRLRLRQDARPEDARPRGEAPASDGANGHDREIDPLRAQRALIEAQLEILRREEKLLRGHIEGRLDELRDQIVALGAAAAAAPRAQANGDSAPETPGRGDRAKKTVISEDEEEITGVLSGLFVQGRQFELQIDGGEVVSGRLASTIKDPSALKAYLSVPCVAHLWTVTVERAGREQRTHYLTGVDPL